MSDSERLKRDLSSLLGVGAPGKALSGREAANPIAAGVGSAKPKPPDAPQQSAGVLISPLTETARTYHDPQYLVSSEGLLTFTWSNTASITSEDVAGREEIRNYLDD